MKKSILMLTTFLILSLAMSSVIAASGVLNVYVNPLEDWAVVAMAEFTKETGIQVNWVRLGSGETYARIRAEAANPRADIWWGGTLDPHIQAKLDGFIEPYVSVNADEIDVQFRDPEGYWHGMYVGIVGFSVNKQVLDVLGLPVPTTWAELVDPMYKDLVLMSSPETSGTAYTILASLIQLMGEEEAFDYLKQLHKNVPEYPKSGGAPISRAALGEVAIGINFIHDTIKFMKEGQPIIPVIPSDGTGYEVGGLSIIKGAPNLEGAKKLVDWTLTARAQELAAPTGSYQLPTNIHASVPEEAVPLSSVNVVDYDLIWAASERDRLMDRWVREVGSQPR